jgi:hypothetical protein
LHVIYIAGWGRSGSTVLAALLGGLAGVFSTGEARSFWYRGLVQRWPCACGTPVPDCEMWSPAADAAATWPMTPDDVARFQATHLRTRHYVTAWPRLRAGSASEDERRYAATYARLHECVAATTGANVVVDSSKYPLDAYLLSRLADVDVRVVHLVRDPRAVAHSWGTPKQVTPEADSVALRRFRPAASSTIWTTWNAMVERLLRHLPVHTVRYEDLVAEPVAALGAIAAFAGVPLDGPIDPASLRRTANHMVAGNPVRFRSGDVPLVEDERWKTEMSRRHRVEATLPALPVLRHYGYPVRA